MTFQIDNKTAAWLLQLGALSQTDIQKTSTSTFQIDEGAGRGFENGIKIGPVVQEIYRTKGLPPPQYLSHLQVSNQPPAKLKNWNYLNQALKKLNFEIDRQTKSWIINGNYQHLAMVLRRLHELYDPSQQDLEDSLDNQIVKPAIRNSQVEQDVDRSRQSLSLSRSEDAGQVVTGLHRRNSQLNSNIEKSKKVDNSRLPQAGRGEGDLLEYVVQELMASIGISRQQAITLLEDNSKYLAHILVKGVKGQFGQIEQLMERFFRKIDFIVQKMAEQNDMCFFFLQVIKPALLSKSQQIAQWTCRILNRIANQLANLKLLPLAYDWFIRQAGGLSTTMLALSRHPKLNQHVAGYILQFSRFNVADVFTLQLRKITNSDQLAYIKFILMLFQPLIESKISSQELLTSGAIDYWVESSLKGGSEPPRQNPQLKLLSLQLLTKIWKAYPVHLEQQLDKVNQVMSLIKRGIRQGTEVVRFTLLELLFNLLDQFANKRHPFASVVYKKMTFLFIENHQELNVREFMLRNFNHIINKYQAIPVDIFLEPFVKQIKIKQNQSYFLNIFDLQFIQTAVEHRKLSAQVALQFFDLLAKIKLNNYQFTKLADSAMTTLLDRYLHKDIFLQYTAKLAKVSLAKFYNTFKHKRKQPMNERQRLLAQKRAQIINFILDLLERGPVLEKQFKVQDKATRQLVETSLLDEIKTYTIQVKVQIQRVLGTTHKGIQRILSMFPNVQADVKEAIEHANQKEETQSNMTSHNGHGQSGSMFPKIDPKYLPKDRDETSSQQSGMSHGTRMSNRTNRTKGEGFPQQDYTRFAEEDQNKFLKEHGIGFKKKEIKRRQVIETEVDPKTVEQLNRVRQKKQEEEKKKIQEQQKIRRHKQNLQNRIQKQLQQRNLQQGIRGIQKDVQVKVLFQQDEINQRLLDQQDPAKTTNINQQQNRDSESVQLVLRKHNAFIKKLFNRYSCGKMNKKDYFDTQNENLAQIDLVRMCKEKNLEKNKQTIIELVKQINDKNIKSLNFEAFLKFLEAITAYLYIKDKMPTHFPMGDLLKSLLKKMALGQNFRLEDDEDETTKNLTEKVRYNPHSELPEGYKKIYERVYDPKRECSFPIKKALNNSSFGTCYQVVNELLFDIFKFHTLEEQVRFFDEARVVKKNQAIPPRPLRKEREEPVSLLEDKETVPGPKPKRAASNANRTSGGIRSIQKTGSQGGFQKENKPRQKIVNAAEKKKMQEEQAKRAKKIRQQQQIKKRGAEIKKRVERMQQSKQRQTSKKKQETKMARQQEQQKLRKAKQQKQRYQRQNKQKLQAYRRDKEEKEKDEKDKESAQKQKEQQQRKQKMKIQMKRDEIKRKQDAERTKKQRQQSEQKNRRKKEEDEKKNKMLKDQVQKKLEEQKGKYQVQKLYKQLMRNIYQEPNVQEIYSNYKQELKALFAYGRQYNEYKLGSKDEGLQQKGWNTICQQFGLADPPTANSLIKQNQKEKGRQGLLFDDFQETLLGLSVKQKEIQSELDNYEQAQVICSKKLKDLLNRLKIPKDKQTIKDYFVGLKNSIKKREQVQVVGPGGQHQTWQLQHK